MDKTKIISELTFKTSKSGGPGGQHVNKTETKVELLFSVQYSNGLTEFEKQLLYVNLGRKVNSSKVISVTVSETRSQIKNKEIAFDRFFSLLERVKTKTPFKAKRKRLADKNKKSIIKKLRGNVSDTDH